VTVLFENLAAWRDERLHQQRAGLTLGFVPTMGALHDGHLSLVRRSRAENDRTVVSIFVNPTQFHDPTDHAQYPRTLETDLEMLRSERTDFVLFPAETDLYGDGFRFRVIETELSATREGLHRPGHFEGVLTIVLKLLHIASADRAYFGEKDWQQLQLVRGMAAALFLPTAIVACATVRESDGLALSSRNRRLGPADRLKAAQFFRILSTAPTPDAAARALREGGFVVDYIDDWNGRRVGAVHLAGVRLIDNVILGECS
jgi:pantoate--beta-alanine ligase